MQQITLSQVLPEVFRERTDLVSEVWRQELSLERGKHYLIEASSGAGKSSFCSFVYGWRGDYSGRIAFDGQDIRALSASAWGRIRRESLSFLFQDMRLFGELTAWDNVWIKNQLTGHNARQTIDGYFEALCIADFLLLDEPISHLDEANGRTLAGLITAEATAQGASVIVTSVGKHLPLEYHHTYQL